MSLVSALNRAYSTIPGLARLGFVEARISHVLRIDANGLPTGVPDDIRVHGKKSISPSIQVPRKPNVTITSGIYPDFLWGKAGYLLGLVDPLEDGGADNSKKLQAKSDKARKQHQAFKDFNLNMLADASSPGLIAFKKFLTTWDPSKFADLNWPEDIRQDSMIIAYDDGSATTNLFDLEEARAIWSKECAPADAENGVCFVTGTVGPTSRLHPSIKGVRGSQSSGAPFASFNEDAFESYGWSQGENASISVDAAFRYGQTLNHFLSHDSGHKFQLGDTTVVYWAEGPNEDSTHAAVELFGQIVQPFNQKAASARVANVLTKLTLGSRLRDIDPGLASGIDFHIAGFAPNAARIITRFYLTNSFGSIVDHYSAFLDDMTVCDQRPSDTLQTYLRATSPRGEDKRIHSNIAAQWMHSILNGTSYPSVLGSTVLTRIKADGDVNLQRIQILKALLVRNYRKAVPMALDPEFSNKGYILGRLFSAYEQTQRKAIRGVKATIKEKFFSSAATSPRRVFPALARGVENHLTKIRRQNGEGLKWHFQTMIEKIAGKLDPLSDPFPIRLSPEEQSLFALGYYHQNAYRKAAESTTETESETTTSEKE